MATLDKSGSISFFWVEKYFFGHIGKIWRRIFSLPLKQDQALPSTRK